jgi:hypothetical protein
MAHHDSVCVSLSSINSSCKCGKTEASSLQLVIIGNLCWASSEKVEELVQYELHAARHLLSLWCFGFRYWFSLPILGLGEFQHLHYS